MASLTSLMWVEKYRPVKLEEVVNQKTVVERLQQLLKNPTELPHLLLAGPPGTGKTTIALCIARIILKEYWRDYTLELNASDERGINTVRERVKTFARYAAGADTPYRIIILDEADEMTNDAQTALRRIMEESSRACRFILVCNYSSGIIPPLQSRVAMFRFTGLNEEDVVTHLSTICKAEGLKCNQESLSLIYQVSGGDLRHAINILQAASTLKDVTVENIKKVAGITGKAFAADIVHIALEGDFNKAREKLVELTRVYGMSEQDFIKYAHDELLKVKPPNADQIAEALAKYDYRLIVGAHPEIQMSALLAEIVRLGKGSNRSA